MKQRWLVVAMVFVVLVIWLAGAAVTKTLIGVDSASQRSPST